MKIAMIRPQVIIAVGGLIALGITTSYLAIDNNVPELLAVPGTCAGGLISLAKDLISDEDD